MPTSLARAVLFGFLSFSVFALPVPAADGTPDGSKDSDAAAKTTAKPSSVPATGLTERELWMLERIEQLEKRVAELESKGPATATTSTVVPSSPATSTSATAMPATPGAIATSPAHADAVSSSSVNPTQDQAGAAQAATGKPAVVEPFSDADWTWLNGNARTKDIYWDTKFFTPEIRFDTNYVANFNHPTDHTISGSSELFRSYEVQLEQLGLGGDFHWDNVRGRFMTQFGMYSATTPRNDASPGHGQWDLFTAYRYLAEAYGGYHFNVLHGVNVDAGIFLSYIGLFSY